MSTALYNDTDAHCAQWLRNLIAAEHIAAGDVDQRDVRDLTPEDLDGRAQCHFFAGIGGWSYALRLAGWPDDRPVWTGSCPCQPFSSAGRRKGHADERHLWPAWARLIRERRPRVVFGEQVAGADGRAWLDPVCTDLEDIGYAVAAVDFPAAGIAAPHGRPRLFFVADADSERFAALSGRGLFADPESHAQPCGIACGMGHAERAGLQARPAADVSRARGWDERRFARESGGIAAFWSDVEWLACRDGKARPTQSGLFPLAHGLPGRVGRLRAYGNAIVPQAAAAVIRAYMEVTC